MMMFNLARALTEYLEGPPRLAQFAFAERCHMQRSKICRLLQNKISCDRDTLDQLLSGIPDNKARQKLVAAYIRDLTSPGALLHLKPNAQTGLWDGFDFAPLSAKGQAALKAILTGPNVRAFEKMLIGLAEALR